MKWAALRGMFDCCGSSRPIVSYSNNYEDTREPQPAEDGDIQVEYSSH